MTKTAAVILCAGKGSRMNDNSTNKVCFDCAGKPVVRRIIDNMREAGVSLFVVVVGHQAEKVMACLDGVEGIVYAFQKEQKGTGHATLCGLKALDATGFDGPVIVSMGDKIITPRILRMMIARAGHSKAVWGVQPVAANPTGGRVVVDKDNKPYGVVELTDAAYMALAGVPVEDREQKLTSLGLNAKKAAKVLALVAARAPQPTKALAGRTFTADEILAAPYANNALYCFDLKTAIAAISTLGSDNAQGEIYLTDALEWFATRGEAELFFVEKREDMLTFSTKPELREISRFFFKTAGELRVSFAEGAKDSLLADCYGIEEVPQQRQRYITLLNLFIKEYGDKKVVIARAPGRANLMGRHIDHRGGGTNVMAVSRDIVFVAAPREDDYVRISNTDSAYHAEQFSIANTLALGPHGTWLEYLEAPIVKAALANSKGSWSNYVKSIILRLQLETDYPLCGMDIAASGNIPAAAGLSSSSAIVSAVGELTVALNALNISRQRLIDLCGEGEWFVGSRGGASDHAAIICGQKDHITHMDFKPFRIGQSVPFPKDLAVIIADSTIKSKKSEGSKDRFNGQVASYEFALMLIRKHFPEETLAEFRDLASIRPYSRIYEMLRTLPESVTRADLQRLLPESEKALNRIFSTHADSGTYDLRGVAMFGISECVRSQRFMELLKAKDYTGIGTLMKISHDGDRISAKRYDDDTLEALAKANADIVLQPGSYACSTPEIDALCDLLNATPGVLGSSISGAGLGGCVLILVEKDKANDVMVVLSKEYYDRIGSENMAMVSTPGSGAIVWNE